MEGFPLHLSLWVGPNQASTLSLFLSKPCVPGYALSPKVQSSVGLKEYCNLGVGHTLHSTLHT